ncbi:MAG: type I methionyl aminopeptidase [Candidatus Veblenbacteria bacterium]|nr:type I methionyl aminopeptidase [Candidatus Veblenbacteria bacterium]
MNSLVKTAAEIEAMRAGGRILATVLGEVAAAVRPKVSTGELNALAERRLRELGATPSFLDYGKEEGNPYPATLCTSVNTEVVHGIPSQTKVLQEGDIVGLDLGCWYKELCTDMAITVPVGTISVEAKKLIKVTRQALDMALRQVRGGVRVGDVGQAVQSFVEAQGFTVVRKLTGHGVGRTVHEEPPIPNFGHAGTGPVLPAGATIAIEPMVNAGGDEVETLEDGWTVVTADNSLSAHFEHTVLVTENGCEILTRM